MVTILLAQWPGLTLISVLWRHRALKIKHQRLNWRAGEKLRSYLLWISIKSTVEHRSLLLRGWSPEQTLLLRFAELLHFYCGLFPLCPVQCYYTTLFVYRQCLSATLMRIQVPKCSSQTYTTRRCTGIVCTVVSVFFLLEIGKMIFNYIFGVLASFAI